LLHSGEMLLDKMYYVKYCCCMWTLLLLVEGEKILK